MESEIGCCNYSMRDILLQKQREDFHIMTNWKKQFVPIIASQAFTLLGASAVQFAVIWWVTIQTESAISLGIAAIVAIVPSILLGPIAGVWVDRYNRRTVMIIADIYVAILSATLGIVFFLFETPPIWFVYIILFMRGIGTTFHMPAMQAAIPMLVPPEMLTKAGGWGSMINSFSTLLGPVMGASLFRLFSIEGVVLIDIFGMICAITCLLFIKIPDIPKSDVKVKITDDMKQGFRAMRENKPLIAIFPFLLIMMFLFMPLASLFPLLVRVHFLGTEWHNGMSEFLFAGGMLASSLILGILGGMKRRFLMASLAIGLMGITALISGALPYNLFWIFIVLCFFMGGSVPFMQVPFMAYIQETIAPDKMGKVFSLIMMAVTSMTPLGLLIAAPISEIIGINWWFLFSGIALIVNFFLCRLMTRKYDAETMQPEKTEIADE